MIWLSHGTHYVTHHQVDCGCRVQIPLASSFANFIYSTLLWLTLDFNWHINYIRNFNQKCVGECDDIHDIHLVLRLFTLIWKVGLSGIRTHDLPCRCPDNLAINEALWFRHDLQNQVTMKAASHSQVDCIWRVRMPFAANFRYFLYVYH